MFLCALVLVTISLVLAVVAYYAAMKRYKVDKIPGPPIIPLLGCAKHFVNMKIEDILTLLGSFHDKYGKIVKIWNIRVQPEFIIADADSLEIILGSSKLITKARAYRSLEPWLGTGLLTSTGTKWHKRRRMLTPAFHFKILENFVPTFDSCSDILVKRLAEEVGKDSTEMYQFINLCALDTICETAMGTKINAQSGVEFGYIDAVKAYLRNLANKEFSVWKNFDSVYPYTSDYRSMLNLLKTLHGFTNSVISQRKEKHQKEKRDENKEHRRKTAFLDLLLEMETEEGTMLSNEDIREEVDTFMFEGHDTVTSAVSFTLYEISRHPEIQDRIVEELRSVFGENFDEPFSYSKVKQLQYLSQVIKEGLRLYPPVALFHRAITEDTNLGNYVIPTGASVTINAFYLQRLPEYFPNPERFDPERFAPENCIGRHPYCYVPFSAGPRNCIGQKFAMLEMQTLIAKILMNYKLVQTNPEHRLHVFVDAILKSTNGIRMKILRR